MAKKTTKRPSTRSRKRTGGQPRKEITNFAEIAKLAGRGLTDKAIAYCLGVSPTTFMRRKAEDVAVVEALEKGRADAAKQIADKLFQKALKGDLGALIWWEKTRGGMTDRKDLVPVERVDTLLQNLDLIIRRHVKDEDAIQRIGRDAAAIQL